MAKLANEIKKLDKKLSLLEQKRQDLASKAAEEGYCKECKKTYPKEKLKNEICFEEGGWYDDQTISCPKGHVIYYDD